jgi:hypothetical protein
MQNFVVEHILPRLSLEDLLELRMEEEGRALVDAYAAENGYTLECLERASEEGYSQLASSAVEEGNVACLRLALDNEDVNVNKLLVKAVSRGHFDVVELLLDSDANPYASRGKPLLLAAHSGQSEIVELLLASAQRLQDCVLLPSTMTTPLGEEVDAVEILEEAEDVARYHGHEDTAQVVQRFMMRMEEAAIE